MTRDVLEKEIGKLTASEWALVDAAFKAREGKALDWMFTILFENHSSDLVELIRNAQFTESLEGEVKRFKAKVIKSIQEQYK